MYRVKILSKSDSACTPFNQGADPDHFNADPDPALHFNEDPDPASYQSDGVLPTAVDQ